MSTSRPSSYLWTPITYRKLRAILFAMVWLHATCSWGLESQMNVSNVNHISKRSLHLLHFLHISKHLWEVRGTPVNSCCIWTVLHRMFLFRWQWCGDVIHLMALAFWNTPFSAVSSHNAGVVVFLLNEAKLSLHRLCRFESSCHTYLHTSLALCQWSYNIRFQPC